MLDRLPEPHTGRFDRHDRFRHIGPRLGAVPHPAAAEEVDAAVVGNPEEPGRQGAVFRQGFQLAVGLKERLLDDILAVEYRSRHAGAVAVQAGAEVANGFEERDVAGLELALGLDVGGSVHIDGYAAEAPLDTILPILAAGDPVRLRLPDSRTTSSRCYGGSW